MVHGNVSSLSLSTRRTQHWRNECPEKMSVAVSVAMNSSLSRVRSGLNMSCHHSHDCGTSAHQHCRTRFEGFHGCSLRPWMQSALMRCQTLKECFIASRLEVRHAACTVVTQQSRGQPLAISNVGLGAHMIGPWSLDWVRSLVFNPRCNSLLGQEPFGSMASSSLFNSRLTQSVSLSWTALPARAMTLSLDLAPRVICRSDFGTSSALASCQLWCPRRDFHRW